MHPDSGYLALLVFLVIVPIAAIVMAVVDRAILRRRAVALRAAQSPAHAFPVIPAFDEDRSGP